MSSLLFGETRGKTSSFKKSNRRRRHENAGLLSVQKLMNHAYKVDLVERILSKGYLCGPISRKTRADADTDSGRCSTSFNLLSDY